MEFSTEYREELYSPETCKCPNCNRILKSEKVLRDHHRYCTRKIYQKCEYCSFVTKYKANLKVHVSTMHLEPDFTDEECPHCAKKYKNQRSLSMHLRICQRPCLFQCYDCKKFFKTKTNLNNHVSRIHLKLSVDGEVIGENRYFKCNDCSYKSKHKDDFKKHVIIHCGDNPVGCKKCGRTYKNLGYLKKHSKTCQNRSVGCYRCSFKTHNKTLLRRHIYELHLKTPRFACADCGKTYKSKEEIVNHIERNCGKEPNFMCEYCPFRTMYRHSLKKHRTNLHLA